MISGTRRERWGGRQGSASAVAEHQSSASRDSALAWLQGRVQGFIYFFSFRIAEFYAVGRCWRTGFERAVICDWTQCATWSLLCLLLPRLLPSPPPPAVFGLWSWLRGWASPRCVAVTEWKVRPIKSTMGAKQMKWWEPYFSLFQRCCFNVGMMHTAIAINFFIIFFLSLMHQEQKQYNSLGHQPWHHLHGTHMISITTSI